MRRGGVDAIVTALTALVGNFAGGAFASKGSMRRLLAAAMLLLTLSLAALPQVRAQAHVMAYAVVMGLAGGFVMVVFFSFWSRAHGRAHLGRIQGAIESCLRSSSRNWSFNVRDHLAFLAGFLRAPWRVGAIAPSSRALAAVMTEDMGLEEARTVIELGPGTGVFTRAICERVTADALVMAVEIDPRMVALLRPRFPRVRIVNDSAEHLDRLLAEAGRKEADAILSGLPWASFPAGLQHTLLAAVVAALRPGARFATFAYIHASGLPPGRRFRTLLTESFTAVETSRVVWANLPPAFVYRCRR